MNVTPTSRSRGDSMLELDPSRPLWRHPVRELRARRELLRELEGLDPETDAHLMAKLVVGHVFSDAFFVDTLFTVAYWRQIAVRTIAPVLHQNGHGKTYDTAKRVNDSLLFFGFIYRDGAHTDAAGATIDRLAAMHERFTIPADDFRYTTASLCFEPLRIPETLGCSALTRGEARALFLFWRDVAKRWGIDVGEEQSEFRAWMENYELSTYARTPHGPAMAAAMADDYCRRFFPGPLRRLGLAVLRSCSDDLLLDTIGQPHPPRTVRKAVGAAVRAYLAARRLVPASSGPQLLRPWNEEYGQSLDPMSVGPDWSKSVAPSSRRYATAGARHAMTEKTGTSGDDTAST